MENKSNEHFIIVQSEIEDKNQEMKSNKKDSDEKIMKLSEESKTMFAVLSNQPNTLSSSPTQKDKYIPPDHITVITANKRAPPLEGGHSTKIGGIWTLKHEIISPKFYELLIKTELKGDTALDIKKFYNYIKMCLNAVTRNLEDLLTGYHYTKRHSDF